MNTITPFEFELAYYEITVQYVSHVIRKWTAEENDYKEIKSVLQEESNLRLCI